jgi:hypothetical protein
VCVANVALLAIYIKKIILRRQKKKNYGGNSNISPCKKKKNPNLQKNPLKKKKPKSFKILL